MKLRWPAAWRRRAVPAGAAAERWLVVDTEASGLDAGRDRLLAIAAIAVRPGPQTLQVVLGDSFEVLLQQPPAVPDKANILVHGIGVAAQLGGVAPALALQAFADFAGTAPLLAFHAGFDRSLLDRSCRSVLGRPLPNPWADIADLAPVLHPGLQATALDDWLAVFGIRCMARHQAAADTLATAELLQRLWPRVVAEGGAGSFRALARLSGQRRWLGA